jgi:hypothetical protein
MSVTETNRSKILCVNDAKPGFLLHISAETPGEPASIVPDAGSGNSIDVSTLNPPNNAEYMDGDAFAYIRGNHVCLCVSLINDAVIYSALQQLFSLAKLTAEAQKFELLKVANTDKLKLIQSEGIKSIDLKTTVYKASFDYSRRHAQAQGIAGAVGKHIKAFIGKPHDVTNDSLQIVLTIKKDLRVRKHLTLGEQTLESLAENILLNQEEDDHFSILLDNGQIVTIRQKLPVPARGKSVDRDRAWQALITFFRSLEARGITGQ